MQKMFIEGKEAPPIAHNLPPIAGALTWCRGLLERIKTPMSKIRKLDKSVMESEEARDVIKDYTAFQGQLSDYEREQIEAWGAEMEKSSQAKLKNPLLRSENDVEYGYPLLYVNFDPLLVRLLREVKYFLLLGFEAPQAALEIYEHAETFRKHMGNLDLVVLTQRLQRRVDGVDATSHRRDALFMIIRASTRLVIARSRAGQRLQLDAGRDAAGRAAPALQTTRVVR